MFLRMSARRGDRTDGETHSFERHGMKASISSRSEGMAPLSLLPSVGDTVVSSSFCPRQLGTRAADPPGVLGAGTPAGSHDGNDRVSPVPERPSCPYALFGDPGRTDALQA